MKTIMTPMAKTTTLRPFIEELEKLSENGKNDNLPVFCMNSDDDCYDIAWFGIETVYTRVEGCDPCLVIQI